MENAQPDWKKLAYYVFGQEYTASDTKQRKKLRDLCRRAVKRYQMRLTT
jgi:hypothetical protein